MKYKCLSIAGFDGSGGAGIQADLKTFSALGCYGMTVLTALPVQNTCGVRSCYEISLRCIEEQMEAIFDDIIPDGIKIGMLFSREIISLIARFLRIHAINIPIVLDPVMVAKSGDSLLQPDAVSALREELVPLATIITPNLPEGRALVTQRTESKAQLASALVDLGAHAVLLKGGHESGVTAEDLFLERGGGTHVLSRERIISENTHGTGCTLSAAICAFLVQGEPLLNACQMAKDFLFQAMLASKDGSVGRGHGPVHHFYRWWPVKQHGE